jgi:hypothetical protein
MSEATTQPHVPPGAALWSRRLRTLALVLLLAVTAGRAMLDEIPFTTSPVQLPAGGIVAEADEPALPLSVETSDLARAAWPVAIFLIAALWMLTVAMDARRRGGVGVWAMAALAFFAAWAAGSAIGASNRYAAWLVTVEQASLILAGIMAANLARDRRRLMLVVAVLAAVAITLAAKSLYQRIEEIPARIASYEADPARYIRSVGTQPGTPKAQNLESRIRDTSVTGFSSLANMNAASLLVTAAALAGLAWVKVRIALRTRQRGRRQRGEIHPPTLAAGLTAAGLLAALAALALTKSKGGVGSAVILALLAAGAWRWRSRLAKHWRKLALAGAACGLVAAGGIMAYGSSHDRLPSKTLTVRWFYWTGGAKLLAEHPMYGVGPGNYASWYLHVREPRAEEEVKTPHNAVVHALVQFGLPGGAAYLALLGGGLLLAVRPRREAEKPTPAPPAQTATLSRSSKTAAIATVICLAAAGRWAFGLPIPNAWLVVFEVVLPTMLLAGALLATVWFGGAGREVNDGDVARLRLCLAGGCLAFVLHNMVTYSLWVPGPAGVFWIALGAAIAQGRPRERRLSPLAVGIGGAGLLAAGIAVSVLLAGPTLATYRAAEAVARHIPAGEPRQALEAARRAARANAMNPHTAILAAKLSPLAPDADNDAEFWARQAVHRDPADSSHWQLLADVLQRKAQRGLGETTMGQALQAHAQAVALNPADARFRIYYGQALMKADRHAQAREQFLTAGRLDQAIVSLDPESNKRLTQAELQRLQQLLAEAMLGAGAS